MGSKTLKSQKPARRPRDLADVVEESIAKFNAGQPNALEHHVPKSKNAPGRVRDHEFVDTTFDPDKREALAQLFALLDMGTPTDGILCIAPAGRVAALVKAVRS